MIKFFCLKCKNEALWLWDNEKSNNSRFGCEFCDYTFVVKNYDSDKLTDFISATTTAIHTTTVKCFNPSTANDLFIFTPKSSMIKAFVFDANESTIKTCLTNNKFIIVYNTILEDAKIIMNAKSPGRAFNDLMKIKSSEIFHIYRNTASELGTKMLLTASNNGDIENFYEKTFDELSFEYAQKHNANVTHRQLLQARQKDFNKYDKQRLT